MAKRRRQTIALLPLLALAAGAIWIRWDAKHHRGPDGKALYFWQDRPAPAAVPAPAQAAPASAK